MDFLLPTIHGNFQATLTDEIWIENKLGVNTIISHLE